MSDHLIAEANRHAMALPKTNPTHADIAWYVREVGELRAEVERLKKQIKDDNRSYGCELRDPYGTIWEQATKDYERAEKAERALSELREWQAGVLVNAKLHHAERKEAIARAERAEAELSAEQDMRSCVEAELATERARLRIVEEFMLRRHIPQAEDDYPQIWLGNGYFDTLADAADAAMKEGTK